MADESRLPFASRRSGQIRRQVAVLPRKAVAKGLLLEMPCLGQNRFQKDHLMSVCLVRPSKIRREWQPKAIRIGRHRGASSANSGSPLCHANVACCWGPDSESNHVTTRRRNHSQCVSGVSPGCSDREVFRACVDRNDLAHVLPLQCNPQFLKDFDGPFNIRRQIRWG